MPLTFTATGQPAGTFTIEGVTSHPAPRSIRDIVRRERWATAYERETADWAVRWTEDRGVVCRVPGHNIVITL